MAKGQNVARKINNNEKSCSLTAKNMSDKHENAVKNHHTTYHLIDTQPRGPPSLECDYLVPLYHLGTTPDHPPTPGYKLAYVPPLGTLAPLPL